MLIASRFVRIQATVDRFAQGARIVRRVGGLVACDLAVLVALGAAEVLQLLDERGARDGDEPGLEQRDAVLVREPRRAAIERYCMKAEVAQHVHDERLLPAVAVVGPLERD